MGKTPGKHNFLLRAVCRMGTHGFSRFWPKTESKSRVTIALRQAACTANTHFVEIPHDSHILDPNKDCAYALFDLCVCCSHHMREKHILIVG